jgi:predicted dehydrogenase
VTTQPTQVGIIGSGTISGIYLENAKKFDAFDVAAIADVRVDAAQARAEEFGVPKGCSVEDLLADPEIEVVINLTPHRVHGQVGLQVLQAGKHVYTEKPLTVYREEGLAMLAEAERQGRRIGGAPDTFLGGAWQTARSIIDEGLIGEPVAAFANLHWRRRPRPASAAATVPEGAYRSFYATDFYEYGGGALFDRGPYYLNALIHLLGPIRRVTGSARKTWEERAEGGPNVKVNVPTHVAGVLDFAGGPVGTILMTNDVYETGLPHIEIYGSEGSLRCIDPNNFGGQLFMRTADDPELKPVENRFGYNQNSRGVGVADLCTAIRNDRPHRASGAMAYHVVDIINSLHDASDQGHHVELASTCDQPAPLPRGLADWTIDDAGTGH